jgi:hypothetical protein
VDSGDEDKLVWAGTMCGGDPGVVLSGVGGTTSDPDGSWLTGRDGGIVVDAECLGNHRKCVVFSAAVQASVMYWGFWRDAVGWEEFGGALRLNLVVCDDDK